MEDGEAGLEGTSQQKNRKARIKVMITISTPRQKSGSARWQKGPKFPRKVPKKSGPSRADQNEWTRPATPERVRRTQKKEARKTRPPPEGGESATIADED